MIDPFHDAALVDGPASEAGTPSRLGHMVWLASFPKSGNTWMRSLLAAYRREDPSAFGFGDLQLGANVLSRHWISSRWGFPTTYLSAAEIRRHLPATLLDHDARLERLQFPKTHDAWAAPGEASVFDGPYSRRAVVIVRNPLAVAPSMAHHMGLTVDEAIDAMANPDYGLALGRWQVSVQIPQHLGDWSSHVRGWLDQQSVPVTQVRYEDLSGDTAAVMAGVLADCGVAVDAERLAAAVAATRFSALREKESEAGFREAMAQRPFFRRGETDSWREELTAAQVQRVVDTHGEMMLRLGYSLTPVAAEISG